MAEKTPPPRDLVDWDRVRDHFDLAPREVEVAKLILQGLPFKQMPKQLGCAYHTVDTHRRRLYEKVGERTRDQVLLRMTLVGLPDVDWPKRG